MKQYWPIALVLTAFLALGTVYNVATPLFEKPDEIWHYPYVKWLADGQGLPVQDLARAQSLMRQESTQPPLYYVTAALATFWIEDDDWQDLLRLNPFWGYNAPGTVNDNKNRILHTERERFPYREAVLAIRVARLVSVIWGGITVLATYLIALELFPKSRTFAAGAAALVAFNPQFLFIASGVSNDSTVSALCTLALWLMLRLVRNWSLVIGHWSLLGLILGLALLAKASALALLPLAMVAIAMTGWLKRSSRWTLLRQCIIVFGIVALIAGWWYTLNWRLHGDPMGVRIHQEIVGPGRPKLTLAQWVHELSLMELSFWAAFGWGNVHAHPWVYTVLRVMVRLSALGLLIMAISELIRSSKVSDRGEGGSVRRPSPIVAKLQPLRSPKVSDRGEEGSVRRPSPIVDDPAGTNDDGLKLERNTWLGLALLLLWGLLVFAALQRWLQWIFAPSGRHLFPAIASIATLLLLGLLQLVPIRWRGKATALLAAAMFAFAVACPLAYIAPAYARPPLLSETEIEAIPNRLDMNFGGMMKLLGYELEVGSWKLEVRNQQAVTSNEKRVMSHLRPGDSLAVTLYWQSSTKMDKDYAVFVHLLDENELILAQRNTFPGLGSFPTTLWQPGDAIADSYTLVLPETTYAPSSAQLEVGLFDFATGERLPVYAPGGELVGDNVRFEEIRILPRFETGLPNPVHFNFGGKIALVGYEMDRRKAQPGEAIHLTLYWQGLAEMRDDYTVFVHLLRERDQIWAGADRQPQPPTSAWAKGQIVVDEYELAIAPDAPSDVYEIEVGLYLPETGDRLDLLSPDSRVMGNRVLLSKVRIVQGQ